MIKAASLAFVERDVIRAVAKRGSAVFNDAVNAHDRRVITTSEDERVHVAWKNDQWMVSPSRSSAMRGSSAWSIGDLVKHRRQYEHEQK
jgi:hypothetical protein